MGRTILLFLFIFKSAFASAPSYVLVAHAGAGDPFWNVQFKGAQEAAKQLGVNLQILAPDRPNDISMQKELLAAAVAKKPAGILVTLANSKALAKTLKKAVALNIPLVAFNARSSDEKDSFLKTIPYIGADDYSAGVKAAGHMKKLVKDQNGKILVLIHQPGNAGLEARAKGILSVFGNKQAVKIDITQDPSQASAIVNSSLKLYKNTLAIFCLGSFCVDSIGKKISKLKKRPLFGSFDLGPSTLKLIRKKVLDFTLDQTPFAQAYMAMKSLYLQKNYAIKPSSIILEMNVIDHQKVAALTKLLKEGVR